MDLTGRLYLRPSQYSSHQPIGAHSKFSMKMCLKPTYWWVSVQDDYQKGADDMECTL